MTIQEFDQNDQRSISELIELLGASDRPIQRGAYEQLLRRGQTVLDAVMDRMTDPNPRIRQNCASLLDHLGDDRCIEPLLQATHDPVAAVRRAAVHSLACDRCKPIPLNVDLIPRLKELALNDTSTKVRQQAVYGLALRNADARIVPIFETIIQEMIAKSPLSKKERGVLFAARWGMNRYRRVRTYLSKELS